MTEMIDRLPPSGNTIVKRRTDSLRNLLVHIAILCLVAIEAVVGYWLATLPPAMKTVAFVLHVILTGLAIYLFTRLRLDHFRADRNFTLVSAIISLVVPVYGLPGMYFIIFAIQKIRLKKRDYFEPDELAIPQHTQISQPAGGRNLSEMKRDEMDIQAFRDILKSNDRQMEEIAINKLSKILTREAVALLQDVVLHATSDTKILAANALIDVEDGIVHKINELRLSLSENRKEPEDVLELARTYDLYCYLGVLDVPITKYYRALALAQYKEFLTVKPKHGVAAFEYGRTLLNAAQPGLATHYLNKAIQYAPESPSPYIWLAEASYQRGDYDSVTQICRQVEKFQDLPEGLTSVTELWTKAEATEA